ncbi:hypothetical protein [Geosporobacter ferrireducens]|nr:hypothetical protein [Geosporobacter ferrireducens]
MKKMIDIFQEYLSTSTKTAEVVCSCTDCQCHTLKGCGCKEKNE